MMEDTLGNTGTQRTVRGQEDPRGPWGQLRRRTLTEAEVLAGNVAKVLRVQEPVPGATQELPTPIAQVDQDTVGQHVWVPCPPMPVSHPDVWVPSWIPGSHPDASVPSHMLGSPPGFLGPPRNLGPPIHLGPPWTPGSSPVGDVEQGKVTGMAALERRQQQAVGAGPGWGVQRGTEGDKKSWGSPGGAGGGLEPAP